MGVGARDRTHRMGPADSPWNGLQPFHCYRSRDRDHSFSSVGFSAILTRRAHARQQSVRALRLANVPAADGRAWDLARAPAAGVSPAVYSVPLLFGRPAAAAGTIPTGQSPAARPPGVGNASCFVGKSGEMILPTGSS